MPNQGKTFEAGGKTYAIRFTQNALYRLEKELQEPLLSLGGRWGVIRIQTMLWAGLEGARLKNKSRPSAFTIDEVGDIIDAMMEEGLKPLELVMEAWELAHPKKNESEGGGGDDAPNPTQG
jgi:hypothetical protein